MKTVESSWLPAPHITTRQIYSVAEGAIGMCKSMRKKAPDENKCLYSAMWIYRTTPLSHNMPSTYSSLEYWYQVATMLYSQLMRTTSTTETWTNYTGRNKPSTTTEKQVKLTGNLCMLTNFLTGNQECTSSKRMESCTKGLENIWVQDLFIKKHHIENSIQYLHLPNEDMILALAGQFKQLPHEPEKFRWLNGISVWLRSCVTS